MSALFNFNSLLIVIVLLVCTCTYTKRMIPSIIAEHGGLLSNCAWKLARIGERKSVYVSAVCVSLGIYILFIK
ncbi:hypothetical protein GJ496_005779 [Pomphorhynchus laevis]|nr:hypothetical protein GJ496_005779 [Pomphorhynchus laevis]